MTITVEETPKSRAASVGDSTVYTLRYIISGTENEAAAMNALAAKNGLYHPRQPFLIRDSWEVDPIPGTDRWYGIIRYSSGSYQNSEEEVFSFDTSGGTQHITQSIQTIQRYAPPGKTAPNHFGAIGVVGGDVRGVDIVVPVFHFSERHYFSDSKVTDAYKKALRDTTGKVNNAFFRGNEAGEVLFRGAQGSKTGNDKWEITFNFSASENLIDITIGSITGIAKQGWQYLWVLYEDAVDDTAKSLIKQPSAVYIEQVYQQADFSVLELD